MYFKNRIEAGAKLAEALGKLPEGEVIVYGLARGGLVVADSLANKLKANLEVLLVKKIGYPGNEEYAVGALAENSSPIFNEFEVANFDKSWLSKAVSDASEVNSRRAKNYRQGRPFKSPKDKIAIIVDDGMATGLSMRAAIDYIKASSPKYLIVAVPVAPPGAIINLNKKIDKMIKLEDMDPFFGAVGSYYEEFEQVEDSLVRNILEKYP